MLWKGAQSLYHLGFHDRGNRFFSASGETKVFTARVAVCFTLDTGASAELSNFNLTSEERKW